MSPARSPCARRSAASGAAGIASLLLAAACGSGGGASSADGPPPVRTVTLEPRASSSPTAADTARAEIVARLEGPQASPPGGDPGGNQGGDEGRDAQRIVSLPGPFGEEPFDRLVLHVAGSGPLTVRVGVLRPGRDLLPPALELVAAPEPTALTLDLDEVVDRARPGEAITVAFAGEGRGELRAVELQRRPGRAFLPAAGPAWFEIEGDLRRAVTVDTTRGWQAEFEAGPGDVLELCVGLPQRAAERSTAPDLSVTLEGPGGSRRHTVAVSPSTPQRPWSLQRFALDEVAGNGGTLSARFELGPAQAGADRSPAGCALAEPTVVRSRAPGEAPRTVLLVTSDTHRADHLGASGSGVRVETPALDRLAAQGLYFENCTAAANVTNPSHVAMLTGTAPRDTGVVDNSSPVSELAPTLAEAFRAAGFETFAAVSASQLAPDYSGLGQGFARFAAPRPGEGDSFDAIAHLERWLPEVEERPLFVWLHLFDAHAPYTPPPDVEKLYWDGHDPLDPSIPEPTVVLPHWARGVRDLDYLEAMYRAEVHALDARLAPVLDTPRFAHGVTAFTADHGEHLGQHDVWFDHRLIYPGTLRVPLILRYPDVAAGTRSDAQVENMHLGRTLLDLAGLESTAFPGENLVSGGDATADGTEPARFGFATYGWSASIELRGWFLVLHLVDQTDQPQGLRRRRHQVELYNLDEDPACERDLVHWEPDMARDLRARLVAYLGGARDEGWNVPSEARDAALSRELAALGYADSAREGSRIDWFDPACECAECARFSAR